MFDFISELLFIGATAFLTVSLIGFLTAGLIFLIIDITDKILDKKKNKIRNEILDLLEEYRKIEKEIGVDFITLIKMLKDDIYINDGGIVDEIGNIYKAQVKSIEHWPVWGFTAGDDDEMKTLCAFKDRGKTWALDKEEFYKNIK